MLKEFKEFALRGNVMEMAIGIILGTAFGKIVSSLVSDIIMPPIGLLLGKVDFSQLYINLTGAEYASLAEARKAGAPTVNYGQFINTTLDFLIVAFVIFLVVRQLNRLQRTPEPPSPATQKCPYCRSTISLDATRCPHCTSRLESESGTA